MSLSIPHPRKEHENNPPIKCREDYFHYIRGLKEAHATCHSSNDDTTAVDAVTADWLFVDDLNGP